ncbi:MAG TPA: PIG-L family deacetylase [Vicinamibacterales bacterium]
MSQTILAIGAHYDDCVFGIPGLLLKAQRRHHRVVVLSVIGDYRNWRPVGARSAALVDGTIRLAAEYGVEMRFLGFAEMKVGTDEAAARAVAAAVADVRPDIAFTLWPHDQHPDHERTAALSRIALGFADRLIDADGLRPPARTYQFDNGPRHTIGFEPDTYVDVTDEWPTAIEWLGRLMALRRNEPYRPGTLDGAQRAKDALARYRGQACGVRYAEAVRRMMPYADDIF